MSLKTTVENYKIAEQLHTDIDGIFEKFQLGKLDDFQKDEIITKTFDKINNLKNILRKINTNDLIEHYDEQTIKKVEHNINFFNEAADYIKKDLLKQKYYDDLLNAVENYLGKLMLPISLYSTYANNEKDMAHKFTSMLLNSKNILNFLDIIKRITIGTMTLGEFKRIFTNNLEKTNIKRTAFESFNNYKNI